MTYVKHLVSKKKKRYIEDGFDLDLAYIKPNIVAMGFPSENLEGVYRNNFDDVVRFLEIKHKDKYKVYNLCSERSYDPGKFANRVSVFPFDDHNAPPFELMEPCCQDLDEWLSKDDKNVAIVHCKAGKGRTGVMICAYLLYRGFFDTADDAMNYYADARTSNRKGVTIPSQRRYITYFGYYANNRLTYEPKTVLLNSITFVGIPTFQSQTCSPSFLVYQTKVVLYKSKSYEERMCVFWFNTFFLKHGVTLDHPEGGGIIEKSKGTDEVRYYELHKKELDKANKDKKHKFFPENFKIRLDITIPAEDHILSRTMESTDAPPQIQNTPPHIQNTPFNNVEDKKTQKTLSLHRNVISEINNRLSPESAGNAFNAPPSPNTKRLTQSISSPLSPTSPLETCDKTLSRSLEVLTLEEEQLSDDDDDESFPTTRV
ncbi:phosphatidylinositol 3,4,5-trisphosphate 3-phosphatase and dual-specificity protein phosphatase PTEN-like isoform X2 [Hydractinia symbiolongicarpus]|uniref:phosphatidylinositol 3,4,5-trisphosphate 3-phosphatase and dual-specificity protein phosphatase PTEN-like isoform X2 n=1 Tax=Hydractinia symbiolongicarpus TaxID=13093 RepID=UPI00254B7F57|nr:phosphatidylinositol 3,4,5-trisphosphate 3-phosphatase and dual-specificity protein phosphatase PTEN-like isoform X2 [Hydractinia symbiolongicarpus]